MNEQLVAAVAANLNTLPVDVLSLMYGIQLGIVYATESDQTKREELIRCGIYEASASAQSLGDHGSHS